VLTSIPTWLPITILVIALLGLADASYLAIEHFKGEVPNCSIIEGCDVVTTSKYSVIFGVPVALLGAMYYFVMATLMLFWIDQRKNNVLRLASYFSFAGLGASFYFVYIQLFILNAICLYCMGSAVSSTLIFIFSMLVLKKLSHGQPKNQP